MALESVYKTAIKRLLAAVHYNFDVTLQEGNWHQFRASLKPQTENVESSDLPAGGGLTGEGEYVL